MALKVGTALRAALAEFPHRYAQLLRLVGEIGLNAGAWKHDDADRQHREHSVVALERRGLRMLRPVRLEGDLRHLAVGRPFGGVQLGALRRAAMQKHQATGRPSYHPLVLLKLYIYGYLNRVQSSRRLEREAGRNIEVMWLLGRLIPDHKTIADFRKDNGAAIRKVCAQFVALCRELGLVTYRTSLQRSNR